MKESAFWQLMTDEFGDANARVVASSLVLPTLFLTAQQALESGTDPRDVWADVCDLHQIPQQRRLGRDIVPKERISE